MRTRCIHCATVFRISAEQLRARNGMVRCGQCQKVFNAFDSLIDEAPPPVPVAPATTQRPADALAAPVSAVEPVAPPSASITALPEAETSPSPPPPEEALEVEIAAAQAQLDLEIEPLIEPLTDPQPNPDETPEESVRAARDAGLVAVRELSETPNYERWSAGTLGGDISTEMLIAGRPAIWPFVTAIVILTLTLLGQWVSHARSDLVQWIPELRKTFASLNMDIPLARQVDLVTIETSDLQSDNARNLLVLQATLKNRAPYAQEWPLLELTLTDANDAIVARRVLKPVDYLPPKADAQAFAGNSEIGLKIWLESKLPAAGYRLYVFYP